MNDFELWVLAFWGSCSLLSGLVLIAGYWMFNKERRWPPWYDVILGAVFCGFLGPLGLVTVFRVWNRARVRYRERKLGGG